VELKSLYGQLKGIKNYIDSAVDVDRTTATDYNSIVRMIAENTKVDLNLFLYPEHLNGNYNINYSDYRVVKSKVNQFVNYLEYTYNLSETVIEVGSIFNTITDEELKSRCSDILGYVIKTV
jgi:hypothetical protein